MGIPSYFSQIVKRHKNIIKNYQNNNIVDNLYLDSNSIIYDQINNLDNQKSNDFEDRLIKSVCDKINSYILKIKPTKKILIAFDGVAPMSKLKHQRSRRYKSWYQSELKNNIIKKTNETWNTSSITPGTQFMEKLTTKINSYFNNNNKIIISSSNEIGEGEHKIFQYIRSNINYHKNTTTVIYGLDSDLIMLSLNHIHLTKQLLLYREAPEFIKSIDSSLDNKNEYLLCINTLFNEINKEIGSVYSYIFMCFLLGNDFLPRFPSLNIRTNGIDKIINAYKMNNNNNFLINNNNTINLNWKNIRNWISILASEEHNNIIEEYELRSKYKYGYGYGYGHGHNNNESIEEKCNKIILQLPLIERQIEEYINPNESGWEHRYYKMLFDIEINDSRKKQICINYLEGLEWTIKYYTYGCPDWTWHYKYDYPPLLCDLIKYVPYFETTLINSNNKTYAVSPLVQLSYVLPYNSLYLLPDNIRKTLLNCHPEWYDKYHLIWAFCKYFWESHVKLYPINIDELTKIVENTLKI